MTYYPILKLSNSEMGALEHLKPETYNFIVPIIESKMIPRDRTEDWWATFRTLVSAATFDVGYMASGVDGATQ